MKKTFSVLLATLLTFNLASCTFTKSCSHVDKNKDHLCDLCNEQVGEHKDNDADYKCDYCGNYLPIVQSVSITNAPSEMVVGDQITLSADIVTFGDASKDVVWSVSNEELASIDKNGLLTALTEGNVVVTVKAKDNSEIKDSVTIIIKAQDWSETAKQLMFGQFGRILPFLNKSWTEPKLDDGKIISSSPTGNLEHFKTIFSSNNYKIQDVSFPYDKFGDTAPGFTATIDICKEGHATVEIADYSAFGKGFSLTAYQVIEEWPASLVEQFIVTRDETIPAVEAKSYSVEFVQRSLYVYCYGEDIKNYFTKLSSNYYIDKTMKDYGYPYLNYKTYFAENFAHTIQLAMLEYSDCFAICPIDAPRLAPCDKWNQNETDLMQSVLGETLPFVNAEFKVEQGELNRLISLNCYTFRIGAFEMTAKAFTDNGSWAVNYDNDSLLYTFTKTSSSFDEKIIVVTLCVDYGTCYMNAYCVDPQLTNWPAQKIHEYIGDTTEETLPEWNGILFVVSYYIETYYALIIDGAGDAYDYVAILAAAGWFINNNVSTYGYFECISPENTLTLVVFPSHGTFQMQLLVGD